MWGGKHTKTDIINAIIRIKHNFNDKVNYFYSKCTRKDLIKIYKSIKEEVKDVK